MKTFAAFLAVLLASSFAFSQDDQLHSRFKKFTRGSVDVAAANINARSGDPITITDGQKTFVFTLTPRELKREARPLDAVNTFKGEIIGEPGSEVRLTIEKGRVEGYVITGGVMWFIEPARKHDPSAGPRDLIIYRAEDVMEPVELNEPLAAEGPVPVASSIPRIEGVMAVDSLRVLEVATEADYQFVSVYGSAAAANNEILSVLNMVEGIYERQLGLTISVTFQNAWSTTDPYTGTDGTLLNGFMNHWNSAFPTSSYPRNVTHLFTGKVSNAGLAYVGTVCRNPGYSYGYTGRSYTVSTLTLVAAHEIGHNLSAEHVESTGICTNTIMNATISSSVTEFCSTSVTQITGFVSNYGSCLRAASPSPTPTPTPTPYPTPAPNPTPYPGLRGASFDFDGDRRADASVFRPFEGRWYINGTTSGSFAQQFGLSSDIPAAADYDGDGRTDIAIFRGGQWHILGSSTGYRVVNFGIPGDVPQPADFTGDNRAEIAVFRAATGVWYTMDLFTGQTSAMQFGLAGDRPVAGDYDGDRRADIAVFRPSDRTWYVMASTAGFTASVFGLSTDKAVPEDYDGDGATDQAVYRGGVWYLKRSSYGTASFSFGLATDIPVPADYDGDGRADAAVFRPADGTWHINGSATGYSVIRYGNATDRPIPAFKTQ